jgi:hypothetical protein
MAEKKTTKTVTTSPGHIDNSSMFTRENYMWMAIGLAIIALGMVLMSGGNSPDPTIFDQKEVYSPRRITVAPILIIVGLGIEIFAVFKGTSKKRS